MKNNIIAEKYTNLKSDKFSKVKFISENIFSSGDFKGNITLFDKRQKTPIKIFHEQSEEITDILFEPEKPNFLLTSSIDSTLCVYDINKLSLYALSDKLDEELNCMLSYKNGNHILCGSGEGNILIFNWDWFGDFKDMIKGHSDGIDDMAKFDENIFLTGTEDGIIRICTMYPKGIRGILKDKNKGKENDVMKDVNKIKICGNKKNVITCSGMDCLRIFDISQIEFSKIYKPIDELDSQDEFENNSNEDEESEDIKDKKKEKIKKNKEESEEENEDDDIKELENEEEEDDEGGEEEEEDDDEENNEIEDDIEEEEEFEEKIKKEKSKEKENIEEDINNDSSISEKKRQKEKSESERQKEKSESEDENKDLDSDDDESDSDNSSSTKKKKSKKVKKIGKKTKSLIAKEERKAFFNDL